MHATGIQHKDVRRLLRNAEELELSAGAVQRLKWFDYLFRHAGNVSLTCRHFGVARSTVLRWLRRFDPSDVRSLEEESRRPRKVRAPETHQHIVEAIAKARQEQPTIGRAALQALIHEMHGVVLSLSTIGRVIARHNLFFGETESHRRKRVMTSYGEIADVEGDEPSLGLSFDFATDPTPAS